MYQIYYGHLCTVCTLGNAGKTNENQITGCIIVLPTPFPVEKPHKCIGHVWQLFLSFGSITNVNCVVCLGCATLNGGKMLGVMRHKSVRTQ